MRPRTELLLVVTTVAVLLAIAGLLAGSDKRITEDERASTLVTGPGGTSGILEATRGLGISVRRQRDRTTRLAVPDSNQRTLLALLNPSAPLSGPDRAAIDRFRRTGDVLLAGTATSSLMRCYGYRVEPHLFDSLAVREVPMSVHAVLQPTGEGIAADSSRVFDTGATRCTVPRYARVTPLLTTARGVVAVRLKPADSSGSILLVADVALFRNRVVRRHDNGAGPFVLGLVAGRYDQVVFEEYHHGFGASGSLSDAVVDWSWRSPWGWAAWQLAGVGVLMLLFGAFRFGQIGARIDRRRRNPIEHLRALATALSAAKGHDEAIGAIVRGLRRRLTPTALRARGDWRRWLVEQDGNTTTAEGRRALDTLIHLTIPGQPASSVLQAANAAEELWQSIRT